MIFTKFELLTLGKLSQNEIDDLLEEAKSDPVLADAIDGFILSQLVTESKRETQAGAIGPRPIEAPKPKPQSIWQTAYETVSQAVSKYPGRAALGSALGIFIIVLAIIANQTGKQESNQTAQVIVDSNNSGGALATNKPGSVDTVEVIDNDNAHVRPEVKFERAVQKFTHPFKDMAPTKFASNNKIVAKDKVERLEKFVISYAGVRMEKYVKQQYAITDSAAQISFVGDMVPKFVPDRDSNKVNVTGFGIAKKQNNEEQKFQYQFLFKTDGYNIDSFAYSIKPIKK